MFEIPPLSIKDTIRFLITTRFSKIGAYLGWKQKQIVVCGYPRGGTSLFYNLLSATIRDKYRFTKFEKYYIHHIHKLGNIATKAPLDIFHLSMLDKLNIHSKSVYIFIIIRDIREVLTSRHPFLPGEYFIGYDHSWWPQDKDFKRWKYDAPGVIEISAEIKNSLEIDNVMCIRYEDLISNPDSVQNSITEKTGIQFDLPFNRYYERTNKIAYSYKGKYKAVDNSLVLEGKPIKTKEPRWMRLEYKERIIEQFTSCPELFNVLISQGYEADNAWYNRLVRNQT